MTENSPHHGTIPFWLYIVPLHLISVFLYVGSAQITCEVCNLLGWSKDAFNRELYFHIDDHRKSVLRNQEMKLSPLFFIRFQSVLFVWGIE